MRQENPSSGDLDARLLAGGSRVDSTRRSGDLRASRRKDPAGDPNFLKEQPTSLRQAVIQQKRKEEKGGKDEGALVRKAATPARKQTSALLRAAWTNLIPSWGLTLIWINTHVFLGLVIGNNFFCKLGEEWTDRPMMGTSGAAKDKLEEKARNSVGLVEKIGLGCLNMGCLLLIGLVVGVIAILVYAKENSWEFLVESIGFLWDSVARTIVKWVSGN